MFRIESYVTPIILSYVDKYVKNIRPQDSQMSLWGGEVSFQNLDLRLDVLEEELNLPFCSFLSGHIHELIIRVPWTKIASEPICVTINTIEFVLKLRDPENGSPTNARKAAKRKKISKYEEPPTSPTGYMASLVNKIANNISIECNNIIFKYVEEDLVMSMNVQLLTINSADQNWATAFVDISPTKVILRKVIELTNLTVCLDQRNEDGRIEMCQEPILYRCSMRLHLLRRYNAPTSHKASLLRLDLKSDAMHINISSVQYPMVMRLLHLLQALKDGSLEKRLLRGPQSQSAESDETEGQDREGLISWAWNLLPTIFPEDNESDSSDVISEHITHFGFDIGTVQVTLKDQKASSDAHSKRIKYQPLLRLQFEGCRGQSVGVGRRWSNFQGSVQRLQISPFEKCVCGRPQSIDYFVQSSGGEGANGAMEVATRESDLYSTNWEDYFVLRSDELVRSREEAIVIDICYSLEVAEDHSTRLSEVGSDLEQSGLRERHLMRVFCNNMQIKLGPSVAHIVDTLKAYAEEYSYPPYLDVKPIPQFNQLGPPSSDDYETLMEDVPLRKYDVQMRGTRIEFEFTDHKQMAEQERLKGANVMCQVDSLKAQYVTPFYANRLVFTTCQLPQWPLKLFEACYHRTDVTLSGIDLHLNGKRIGHVPLLEAYTREIIYPHLWMNPTVLAKDLEVTVAALELGPIDGETIALLNGVINGVVRTGGGTDLSNLAIQLKFGEIKWIQFQTRHTMVQQFKMQHISGCVAESSAQKEFMNSQTYKDSLNVLDFLIQTPLDEQEVDPAVITMHLGKLNLTCNNSLLTLVNIWEIPRVEMKSIELNRKISVADESTKSTKTKPTSTSKEPRPVSRRSGSVALESVHSSSEKNATVVVSSANKVEVGADGTSFRDLFDRYKTKIISCDIKALSIVFDFTEGKCVQRIRFPDIEMLSSGVRVGELKRKVPISNEALDIVDKKRFFFPWSFQFVDFSCDIESSGQVFTVVESFKSNVTLLINERTIEDGSQISPTPPLEFVIYVATTPVVLNCSEMAMNYCCLNWKTVQQLNLFKAGTSQGKSTQEPQEAPIEIAKRPISPDSSFDLKKLFDSSATIDTKDDSATEVTEIQREAKQEAVHSLWMQLAFEKLHVNLFCNAEMEKFSLKAQDIICSVDQREAYFKLKTKVGSVSGKKIRQAVDEPGTWIVDERLSFLGRNSEPSNVAFVDLTVTRVGTGLVHSKWGVKRKHRYMNDSLLEVMLKVQNMEAKLDLEELSKILTVFNGFGEGRPVGLTELDRQPGRVASVADLPLVFFESKGAQIYLPVRTTGEGVSSVFVLKIHEISISPTVENPLTRNAVRADIYTKATQLGILHLPGSRIEDRQYEVQFKQMSLETADWNEMLSYMSNLGSGYENPAVAWNNPTKDETLEIWEVFKDFNFSIVLAPAIVFNNVLVCGPSIELSCISDLNMKIRMGECKDLLALKGALDVMTNRTASKKVLQQTARVFKDKRFYNELKRNANKLKKAGQQSEVKMLLGDTNKYNDLREEGSRKMDSGISSIRLNKKSSKASAKDYKMNIPYDVTFLGGNFYINLYETGARDQDAKRSQDIPLVKVFLYQPNLTLTQSVYDRTVNIGIFNMAIQLPDEDHTDEVFNSHQGKLNALGIPPSVIRVKFIESVTKERMLTVNLFRPMRLTSSQRILNKLDRLAELLAEIAPKVETVEMRPIPDVVPKEWILKTKARFFKATKLSFSITQLELIYNHDTCHQVNLIVSQLSTNCLIQDRPKKMTIEMMLKGLSLKTNDLTLLHPTQFSTTVVLTKEFWQRNPVITVSGDCNFIQLDLGPKNIICLQAIAKSFGQRAVTASQGHRSTAGCGKPPLHSNLIRLSTPKIDMDANEEFYQDDLRAGAFQFVEISSDHHLPLPYQIQVINRRDNRIICWKYPQPRALQNVEILPVPFNVATSAAVKCYLEFYSESRCEFMTYCEFFLSESQKQTLNLPKKRVTACVWRVVMRTPTVLVDGKLFEEESSHVNGEETAAPIYNINDILHTAVDDRLDDGPAENILKLHPNILIACMKVDSCFKRALIANCNVYLLVQQLEVNVMNELVAEELTVPKLLAHYKGPCNVLPLRQHVGKIRVDNWKLGANIFDEWNMDIQWVFGLEVNLVDYAYLRLMPFVEHFRFNGYLDCENGEQPSRLVNLMIPNSLKIRLNPSMVHTVHTMAATWSQSLNGATVAMSQELIVMTRFIIGNSTNALIYYGQTETTDLYPVLPKGFDFYSFRSVIGAQSLEFAMDGETGRVQSEACVVGEDAEHCLRMGHSFIVVNVKSISSTQRMITVRGQMEIFNLSREKFVLELGTEEERKPLMLLDKSASIVSQSNLEDSKVLRICFESIGHWSGDIPIRPSGKRLPWLVKVPVAKNKYLSYWIRIVTSAVDERFSRIVVIVLPLYLVRSYLPKDTIVKELKLQKTCQVFGRGALNELHLMGTHDDEHILKFNENFRTAMGQDRSEILLSYKAMDVAKLFPLLDEQRVDVQSLIDAFEQFSYEAKAWPMDSEWEARITRLVSEPDHFVPLCDFGSLLNKEKLFNSLVLEVAPWCLFINASGLNVFLKNDQRSMFVAANHLGTPFDFVDNKFTLQLDAGDQQYLESAEILLGAKQASKKDVVLVDGEVLHLEFGDENGRYLLKMLLEMKREGNRRILVLSSQYVAVNYTQFDLSLFAITVPLSTDRNMVFSKGLFSSPEMGSYKLDAHGEGSVRGTTIAIINNEFIGRNKKPKKSDAKLLYMILSTETMENFCPINITEPFARRSLNVPGKTKTSASLIVSVTKENDQLFVAITEDHCPDIELHNRTDYNLSIAQSESTAKMVGPVRECEHFQWFPILPGKSFMNYSPSLIYKNYPQLTTSNTCGLSLAVTMLDGVPLKWSQPFSIASEAGEVYLALPGKNDIKVVVSTDKRTTSVAIEAVNANEEFSLSNVRSRLLHPIEEEEEEVVEKQEADVLEVVADEGKEVAEPPIDEPIKFKFTLFVKEIGLFVATEEKNRCWAKGDIVSVTLDDVLVEFDSERRRLRWETGNIQIDNQLAHTGSYDFPVVFCAELEQVPREIPSQAVFNLNEIVRTQQANPLLVIAIKLYTNEMGVEEFECQVRPIRLYLEDTYLSRLGDALTEFLPHNAVYATEADVEKEVLSNARDVVIPMHLEALIKSLGCPLRLKVFKLGSVDVLISLHTSNRFYIALDHSPLSFSAFERVNLRTTALKLGSSISLHYLSGAIFGAGWMVGSLEILGSPSGLARSVTTGLKDFVSKPVEGLFKGPWEFMAGVTLGSVSLVRNITAGTVNSVTKLATSVARNLDRLTLDAEHVQRTDLVRRYRPLGVAQGFTQGLTQFGITLLGAIGGLSRHTMAAKTPGQVLSGVGKGLMGVILKPISGAAELVAYTGNGVLHSVGYNTLPSCRSLSVSQGVLSPSQCQLSWKILQPIMDTHQVLFTHIVTMIQDNKLVPSFFGFSDSVVICLNLETDEVMLCSMSVVHPQIDGNDPTIVHLRIVSKIPATEENEQYLNLHHIASRVREYIQSSREHLPMCGMAAGSADLSPEIPIVEGFVVDRTISFYVQSNLAQHLVDYIKFLKYFNHEKYS